MKNTINVVCTLLIVGLLASASGCTTLDRGTPAEWNQSTDPLEKFNRGVYSFNSTADTYVLRPVAKTYGDVVPGPAKKGISNFFSNLSEPWSAVNNLLQGKTDRALQNTYRFVVNSTIGLGGLFDVAGYYQVEKAPEDLGQTLASWGVKPGPYIVVPFYGPTTLRDGAGRSAQGALFYPISRVTSSVKAQLGLVALDGIDTRAGLLGVDDALEKQLDPYLFMKTAYDNNRFRAIMDGKVVEQDDLDF